MKKKEKKKEHVKQEIDKRKLFGTIIGGILFLSCILFFTYAYYNWKSENTAFSFDIQDASVICENGPGVNVSNIGPVLDYHDGVAATFKVENSGIEATTFTLSLNITSISDALLVESFKYIVLKGSSEGSNFTETGIAGNFSTFQVGSNTISEMVSVDANTTNTFKFIVYIDGSMYNNSNMMESSMNSNLVVGDCDSTINKYLSGVLPGSYVVYTGTNGCPEGHCDGTNANYVSDTNMGYCSSSAYKFSVNGWRVGYVKDGSAYLVSAGAPECIRTYGESKSSSTSSRNFTSSLTYLTSSTATKDADTSSFSLDDPTSSYTFPTDISSLNKKFTCSNNTDGTCTTLYSISTDSTNQSLTLKNYNTGSCTTSSSSTSSNYKKCMINSYCKSTSSSTVTGKYWGTSYVLTDGGFQLSGTISTSTTYKTNQYTCKSTSSSAICSTIYYSGTDGYTRNSNSGTSTTGCSSTGCCYSFVSYTSYKFSDFATYYSLTDNNIFGSNYEFDISTGKYTLTNTSNLSWENDYTTIVNDKKYTCFDDSGFGCSTMYEITGDSTSTKAVYYTYTSSSSDNVDNHIVHLDDVAKTYCNVNYAYGGVCNANSVWAMDASDFEQITGSPLYYNSSSEKSCYQASSSSECGYGNNLIDNGGFYWYATRYGSSSANTFFWTTNYRYVSSSSSNNANGVRPVLRLESSVQVVGGSGTYADPYQISLG